MKPRERMPGAAALAAAGIAGSARTRAAET